MKRRYVFLSLFLILAAVGMAVRYFGQDYAWWQRVAVAVVIWLAIALSFNYAFVRGKSRQ